MIVVKISENSLAKIGEVVEELEKRTGAKIRYAGGVLYVEGDDSNEWICEQVLNAISNGFSTKNAFKLFSDEYFTDEIDLEKAVWNNEKALGRIKGRIIGGKGKAKKTIEELTGARIVIGEKKVFFLGRFDEVKNAKEAVLRLMEGAKHAQVYNYLRRLS